MKKTFIVASIFGYPVGNPVLGNSRIPGIWSNSTSNDVIFVQGSNGRMERLDADGDISLSYDWSQYFCSNISSYQVAILEALYLKVWERIKNSLKPS